MSEISVEEIEKMLNDYFTQNEDNFFVRNLGWVYKIMCEFFKIMPKRCNQEYMKTLESRIPIYSNLEIFEFVREYLNKYNIKLDFNRMLRTNKIVLEGNGILESNKRIKEITLRGHCPNKQVIVSNNASYLDSVVLVHELSHFRTILDKNSKINFDNQSWYDEILAISEEFIMADSSLTSEKQYVFLNRLNSVYNRFNSLQVYLKLALVYKKYGNISKENYIKFWENDRYDIDIKKFREFYQYEGSNKNTFFRKINENAKYSTATIIALHLMYKVRQNIEYMSKIERMHKLIFRCSANTFFNNFDLKAILANQHEFCDPVKNVIEELVIYSKINGKI